MNLNTIEDEKSHSEKEFGGGIHRNFNKISFFIEYSHVQSHLKDDFATFGLMYNFK